MTASRPAKPAQVIELKAKPLTATAFAPYGDVIEASGATQSMNQGYGRRYRDLAHLDITGQNGRPALSLVACIPEQLPVRLRLMERHPLSSQVFHPLDGQRYLVVVAPAGAPPQVADLRAFVATGGQGINYRAGTWHHPMIALDKECTFLEIHRAGPEKNCDEVDLPQPVAIRLA